MSLGFELNNPRMEDTRGVKAIATRITVPFALRALWVAGALDRDIAKKAGSFLRARLNERESIIDMISLIFGAAICEMAAGEVVLPDEDDQQQVSWRSNVAGLLESLRTL